MRSVYGIWESKVPLIFGKKGRDSVYRIPRVYVPLKLPQIRENLGTWKSEKLYTEKCHEKANIVGI